MLSANPPASPDPSRRPAWWRCLNRYHWFVLVVAALGWLFDCLDQQLFNIARVPAMKDLLGTADMRVVTEYGGYATAIFLVGGAAGGLGFGILGDRIGRARTMLLTILIYSICTGLSAASVGFWDFAFYRFLTGLGVGGEWAVGVALVAETMPDRARPYALGLLQTLSTVGNVTAALISMSMGWLEQAGHLGTWDAWRVMFLIGALPAFLAVFIRRRLKEPERWQQVMTAPATKLHRAGSYAELFGHPRWRRHALIGFLLAFAGVVGLWGILFFSIDLIRAVLRQTFEAQGLAPAVVAGKLNLWAGIASIMINVGAFAGMWTFSILNERIGRRPSFGLAFVLALVCTALGFALIRQQSDLFWLVPLMAFGQFGLFAGYAIYFPELFPTRLRSTGVSFCYNVGRFVAAAGPLTLGLLTSKVFGHLPGLLPLRYAGISLCAVFLIGLAALPFAPETKGQGLPED
ncbi:MAG: MFS transporter [Verrucomicrobia bacterium]|nr:MFS transporter [Verrucomicrobiota bacterium]